MDEWNVKYNVEVQEAAVGLEKLKHTLFNSFTLQSLEIVFINCVMIYGKFDI